MLPETITTDRLRLRPYSLDDVDDVLAYAQDPEWARFLPVPQPYLREHAKSWLADQIKLDRLGTGADIVATFRSLAAYVREHDILSLGSVEESVGDPLMKKGIRLLVDGWEPLLRQSMLEKQKAALIQDLQTRYDMILDGIDALGQGGTPEGVEEILNSHIARS